MSLGRHGWQQRSPGAERARQISSSQAGRIRSIRDLFSWAEGPEILLNSMEVRMRDIPFWRCQVMTCIICIDARRTRIKPSVGLFFVLAAVSLQPLWAQRDTGTIRGTATDSTGAVIPQVQITITDERTNVVAFTTETDEAGRYVAPALKASVYLVSAEISGFKKANRRGVILDVNQVAIVDITLDVGEVSEVLEVSG